MPRTGRHRTDPPEELAGGVWPAADDAEARLLGQRRSMRAREVSAKAAVSIRSARKFWHALGFPHVQDEDTVFTDADLDALRSMAEAIGALPQQVGTAEDGSGLATTRAMPDPATARAAAAMLVAIADDLEPLLVYAWRRHLAAAISRMVTDAEPIPDQPGVVRSVGFADLVSFTALVRRVSDHDLARVVQRFEALASDVVTAHGGRVIKTVGDEVLFVAIGAGPAAAIALDLVEAMADDEVLPDVRVGMASGRVISRLGDVFGTTVNLASRLTAVAKPGTVVVDDVLAASLASMSGFEMSPLRRRALRGIGPVTPWVLRRAELTARRGMMGHDEAGRAGDDGMTGEAMTEESWDHE
jgi:adenylate cyclase